MPKLVPVGDEASAAGCVLLSEKKLVADVVYDTVQMILVLWVLKISEEGDGLRGVGRLVGIYRR